MFVFTFVCTPDLLKDQGDTSEAQIDQTSKGSFNPPIIGNTATINIDGRNGKTDNRAAQRSACRSQDFCIARITPQKRSFLRGCAKPKNLRAKVG